MDPKQGIVYISSLRNLRPILLFKYFSPMR